MSHETNTPDTEILFSSEAGYFRITNQGPELVNASGEPKSRESWGIWTEDQRKILSDVYERHAQVDEIPEATPDIT